MGWLTKIFGVGGETAAKPIEAVGNVLDKVFTSDEERLDKKIILERLRQEPSLAQIEVNKLEAQHRTVFVAGWRPFIGWVCGWAIGFNYIINPILQWLTGAPGPELQTAELYSLVLAMLGLGTLRTVEKSQGAAK